MAWSLIKFLIWFRTLIYSTILFPRIIDFGEGQFGIKIYGRVLFFMSYYIKNKPSDWLSDIFNTHSKHSAATLSIRDAKKFDFAVDNPEDIIKEYISKFETKVYTKKYITNNNKELTLKEYKNQVHEELMGQFATDEIDYDTFIKKTNELKIK